MFPDDQAKRGRPDDMLAMKMDSQRMTSSQPIKEERISSQADSTDDVSQDRTDMMTSSNCHVLGSKHDPPHKRLPSGEASPAPSPTPCQYGGALKSGGY
ncbi:unnamed protein product, partial [Lymnaea stagnalis]